MKARGCLLLLILFFQTALLAQRDSSLKVIAFYTAENDLAHISFVKEAHHWFDSVAAENNFSYDTTSNWNNMNTTFLKQYKIILFLDTRPEQPEQRKAFENYMKKGGAWIGFHFAGFALTASFYTQNWDWYHNDFLGSGAYKGNTWRPTSAILKKENSKHRIVKDMPATFTAAPNEWYSWEKDLRQNKNINILYAIDSSSFPLGTGPKQHEIWRSGYYPVIWTNKKYKMLYMNMGHNDMDYEGGTNKPLSSSFSSHYQNQLLVNAIRWMLDTGY